MRELAKDGVIGRFHGKFYSTSGPARRASRAS
jgi:hypothetical protein